ncbi:hypothetical protein AAG570_000232 [Ranatra chinensis]|uniref:Uncharacterized protein n=1 Tax=Ranatra chinensis TaxID=642074 RepID=A0ABD0YWH0_9HEMI
MASKRRNMFHQNKMQGTTEIEGLGAKSSGSGRGREHSSHEWITSRKSLVAKLSRYDLLIGVVKAEAFFSFTGDDVQYGIEPDRRTNILRTFVKNTYRIEEKFLLGQKCLADFKSGEYIPLGTLNVWGLCVGIAGGSQSILILTEVKDCIAARHRVDKQAVIVIRASDDIPVSLYTANIMPAP